LNFLVAVKAAKRSFAMNSSLLASAAWQWSIGKKRGLTVAQGKHSKTVRDSLKNACKQTTSIYIILHRLDFKCGNRGKPLARWAKLVRRR